MSRPNSSGITNRYDQSKLTNSDRKKENKGMLRRLVAAIERRLGDAEKKMEGQTKRQDKIEKDFQREKLDQLTASLEQTRRFERMVEEARKEARDAKALLEETQEEDNLSANEKILRLERMVEEFSRQLEVTDEKTKTLEENLQLANERAESNAREIEDMKRQMDEIKLEHRRHAESVDRKLEQMETERLNGKAMRITARLFLDQKFPEWQGRNRTHDAFRSDEEAKVMRVFLDVEIASNMNLFEDLRDLISRENARPNEVMRHLPRIIGNNPALGAMIQNSCAALHDITNTNGEM